MAAGLGGWGGLIRTRLLSAFVGRLGVFGDRFLGAPPLRIGGL